MKNNERLFAWNQTADLSHFMIRIVEASTVVVPATAADVNRSPKKTAASKMPNTGTR